MDIEYDSDDTITQKRPRREQYLIPRAARNRPKLPLSSFETAPLAAAPRQPISPSFARPLQPLLLRPQNAVGLARHHGLACHAGDKVGLAARSWHVRHWLPAQPPRCDDVWTDSGACGVSQPPDIHFASDWLGMPAPSFSSE